MGWLEDALRQRLAGRIPRRAARGELRPAAVLIPLVSLPKEHHLLLTLRSSSLRRQPGDISFPGGAVDAADPTPLAAALRESEEEVGLLANDVEVLGQLDEQETVTGFRITPFIGAVVGPYSFQANHEVEELIMVPLSVLRQPEICHVEYRRHLGGRIPVYHYYYQDYDIWGLTGRLIKVLLEILPEKP